MEYNATSIDKYTDTVLFSINTIFLGFGKHIDKHIYLRVSPYVHIWQPAILNIYHDK